jgi:prepilin-type N-terminal cleavage/methylation domain-containing protein
VIPFVGNFPFGLRSCFLTQTHFTQIVLLLNACGGANEASTVRIRSPSMPGPSRHASSRRFTRAFTVVEIMVVVVIIGLLAAAGLPSYRHLTMRSKVTALENDLRQFATAIQTYTLQNGHWPANGDPQVIPPELASAIPDNFTRTSPIGGVYKWNFEVPADGVTAKAAIVVQTASGNPVTDDEDIFLMIDRQMDDGVLETGNIQVGSTNSLVFVIEK